MLWKFLKRFSTEMIWIFIIIIVGFYLLSILQDKVGGPVGNVATNIKTYAQGNE